MGISIHLWCKRIPSHQQHGRIPSHILPEFRALWIQTGIYFLATCLVFRQQIRSARLNAGLPAEEADVEDEMEEILAEKKE